MGCGCGRKSKADKLARQAQARKQQQQKPAAQQTSGSINAKSYMGELSRLRQERNGSSS